MVLDTVAVLEAPALSLPLDADDPLIRGVASRHGHSVPELVDRFQGEWQIVSTACETFGRHNAPDVDWVLVAQACETMLSGGPADLRLAGVLVAAEFFAGRITRMPRAAAVYGHYVASCWVDMPVPPAERGYLFSRLIEPLVDALKSRTASSGPECTALSQAASLLGAAATAITGAPGARRDLATRLDRLSRALAAAARSVQPPEPPPAPRAEPETRRVQPIPATWVPHAVGGDPADDLMAGSVIAAPPPARHAAIAPEDQETPPPGWEALSSTASDWRARGTPEYWPRIAEAAWALLADGAKDQRAAGLWLVAAWWMRDGAMLRRAASACRILAERFWAAMPLPANRRGAMFLGIAADMPTDVAAQAGLKQAGPFAAAEFRSAVATAGVHLAATAQAIERAGALDARQAHPKLAATFARLAVALGDAAASAAESTAATPAATEAATEALLSPSGTTAPDAGPPAIGDAPAPRPEKTSAPLRTEEAATTDAQLLAAMRDFAIDRFGKEGGAKDDWRAFAMLRQASQAPFRRLVVMQAGVERPITLRGPAEADVARLARLRNLDARKDPATTLDVLAKAELAMASFPLWLDHHRVAADVLAKLGPALAPARAAVIGATATLLLRLPGLVSLHFEDGRPLADEETQRWISTDVLPGGGGNEDAVDGEAEALALAEAGRHAEALALLSARRAATSSGRMRFRIGLAAAALLLRSGQAPAAALLLEELAREADAIGLDRWEPPLMIAALRQQVEALEKDEDQLRQSLRSPDASERLRAEAELGARGAALRTARRRLGALDPLTLFGRPAAAARSSTA
jgi:type VI secretion system protein VasJ